MFAESPEWLDSQEVQGQFYGFVTGVANLTCQAEAEPPPTFRWLDAENNPVSSGSIVSEEYKVSQLSASRYELSPPSLSVGLNDTSGTSRSLRGLHLHSGEYSRQTGESSHADGGSQARDSSYQTN